MPPGRIISLASGPVSFDAHQWHCTQPWHGDRVVLVGFTVKGSYLLPPDMVSTLEGLGFALPGNSTGESTAGPLHPPRFPVFLELAGTGRVTARWRALGAPGSLAVNDQVVEGCATHPRKLDSAEAADQALALEWLRSPYVLGAHLSPPSGTCSRARDIRLPGDPGPPPLRSDTFPDGLPISSPTTLGELLLWKEITCDLEYPDCQVFDEVTQGVQLTGCTPVTNLFPPTYKPSNRSLAGVDVSAESLRQRVLERAKPQGEEDTTVHSKTQEEREKGWIRGPIPVSDLSWRMIFVQLIDSWLSIPARSSTHTFSIGIPLPTKQKRIASRSVYSFLRVAHAIWWVGCTALSLMWTVFFDDYVTLTSEQEVRHTDAAVVALFKLLGWSFDECGEKSTEFGRFL
ncbi:unnamed protein product [Symbiodinium natans]|uniref:Uncharacterized protein n=1 Tax=Symbiodinium natans TaxID=878477 RepID=A0A812LU82_9DINO|nr:unnamed protein product [Symbiodinium natans]